MVFLVVLPFFLAQLLLLLLVFLLLDCFLQLLEKFCCFFIELFPFAMALGLLDGWDESHLLASYRVHALVSEVPKLMALLAREMVCFCCELGHFIPFFASFWLVSGRLIIVSIVASLFVGLLKHRTVLLLTLLLDKRVLKEERSLFLILSVSRIPNFLFPDGMGGSRPICADKA